MVWYLDPGGHRPAVVRLTGRHVLRAEVQVLAVSQAALVEPVVRAGPQYADAVLDAAPQVDRRRFVHVPGRAGQLADPGAGGDGLGDDLVVEHEVIGVALDRQPGEK